MITVDTGSGGGGGARLNLGGAIHSPIFWGGTALIVGAYFVAKGSADQIGQGANNALVIVGIGLGAALMIYAVRKAA
jgi:hypothetical protein